MNLPLTWVNDKLSKNIDRVGFQTKDIKLDLVKKYNPSKDLEGFLTDINEPTIPEYLSFLVARSRGRSDLEQLSPVLQAVISYKISAYDCLEDNHLYKCGRETVLKTRGKDYLLMMMDVYSNISTELGARLQDLGIDDASRVAKEQYEDIIRADKRRNSKIIQPLKETIKIQEALAGEPARKLAYLSGGGLSEQRFLFHLVNSICTLEDLMHFLIKKDLKEPKSTIPLSFMNEQTPLNKMKENPRLLRKSVRFTLDYINNQMSELNKLKKQGEFKEIDDFTGSINRFIKQYILSKI